MSYVIKYAKIRSSLIENVIHPPEAEMIEKAEWMDKLEESILSEGFRNPIVVTATKDKITPRYGGCRLMIAQKHGLQIPAIIADFDNVFSDVGPIPFENIEIYFKDKPKHIIRKSYGLNISGCADAHMEDL